MNAKSFDKTHLRYATNAIIGGMNGWINHHLSNLGVNIIHYFDLSLPMEPFTKDGIHYQYYMEEEVRKHKGIPSVGGLLLTLMLNHICI